MEAVGIDQALKRVDLFAALSDEHLALIGDSCRVRRYRKRDRIFCEGDPGYTLYIIISGLIAIERMGSDSAAVHIATRGPGDFFGELSMLDGEPRSADAAVIQDAQVLTLSHNSFMELIGNHPALARSVLVTLAKRLRAAAEYAATGRGMDLPARIFLLMADMVKSTGDDQSVVYVTQSEIAEKVGAVRTSVNRAISKLRDAGVLHYEADGYRILNWDYIKEAPWA